ncbi:MAG TPA: IPT/TIG domain-containing protein, partial [Anaeromyxobacteraceae bacterium]|nr:IPT/TIG domain-containing protein [Anaeromyxobacteraceae bacterium]
MSDPLARLRSTALLSCLLVLAACSGGSPSQGGGSGAPLDLRGETPEQGPASGGNPVDVTGDGFTEGVTVAFGGAVSSSVKVIDAHTLRAIAPPHAPGRVGMDVTRPDGKSFHRPDCYEYIAAPALSSIEPGQVPVAGNVSVVLVGTGFQPGAVVSFGGIPATATQWLDAGRLTAVAPPHAGGGRVDVTVRNPDGQQSTMGGGLNYLDPPPPPPPPPPAPPTLAALSPITGPISGGTQVTLSGSGFVDGAQVRFGANPATVSSVQPTQIVALTPLGAVGGVDVVVVNPDGQVATLAGGFTYFQPPPPAPSIGSAAPTSGPTSGGTVVGLTGANFKPGATVSIGGIGAPVVGAVTSTHIDVTTPAHGPGTVDIVVANPDGQRGTLAGGFAYVAPPPTLASISVTRGPVAGGTAVTLSGTGFLASAAVTVGGVTAPVVGVTPTSIAITTPPHAAGAADVVVTNTDGQSASLAGAFTYLGPAPAISTIAPASGPVAGSTAVTVTGTGFGAAATVSFGGVLAAVTTRSATALGVTAPPHATGTVDVVVANPDGQVATSIGGYTYLAAAPAIASFSPASGPDVGGPPATVTVTGTGFQPSASVSVGGAGAVVLAASATSITVLVPVHPAGPAAISVTNPDGQTATSSSSFTFTAAPSIASVTPPGGPAAGGTLVTVAGAAFQAGASVTVGGVAVASTFVSATTLTFTAPAHAAGAADVVVTNPAPDARQAAKAAAFTFTSAPAIASLSPASGFAAGGQTLTVAGSGFQAPTSVTVGGAAATLGPWTATQITVTTPRGTPGPAAVVVTNADGQTATAPVPFAYVAAPAVAGVSPPSGPASLATAITVSGSGFQPGATVTVGGATATAVAVAANGASLTATAPPHAPGLVDVAVANPDGQRSALPGAFTYVAGPSITSLAPASGPTSGGTAVSVTGSGFQAGSTVTFGGAALPAAGVTVTPTLVTFVTPPGPAGVAGVTIVGPDGQSASSPAAFTYLAPPALAAVAPASGSTLGGDALVLSGTGFRAGATVTIGGVSAAVGPVTATTIAVTSPPHAAGPVAVTVANADGQSSTLAAAYTYVAPPPALLSIAPTSGPEAGGTIVVLTGANFSGAAVTIGGLPATVSVAATASLTVTAPAHAAGPADVVVTNADGQKATLAGAFTYVAPPPRFLSLTPASGPTAGGGTLTVAGSGFQPGATATLGGAAAAVGAVTPTSLTLTAPPHAAGAVDLVVVNPDRQSFTAAAAYTYVAPAPAIASALPASGPSAGGTKVTVAGSGFAATAAVALGGSPVVGLAVAPGGGSLTFTTPPHAAGAAALSVTNPDGQAATLAGAFTFVAPPVLSAVAPLAGPIAGGTPLTLSGSGFQAGATVTVAGVAATGVALTGASSITAVAPPHAAGPADVVVTNPDGQSSTLAAAFTYRAPPPAIASVSPASGLDAGGTTVLVTGTGFSAAAVTFGGAPALVLGASATSLTVSSPVHPAGPVDVVVTNGDGQAATATAAFTYAAAPPAIASIAPTSGSTGGGTAVTIAGSGFQPGASVAIGGVAAVVGSTSATAIVASTPAHAAGLADVVVTNPDGQKATLAGAFTFVAPPPAIAGLAPASGPTAGGTAVTLTGSAFQPGATVSVGGVAAAVGAVAPTSIALTTPAHAFGAVDVVVTNPDGRSATLAGGFTYVAPAPTFVAVAPASGPTA